MWCVVEAELCLLWTVLVDGDVAVTLWHLQESLGDPVLVDRRLSQTPTPSPSTSRRTRAQYITFSSNELEDRNQQPLQTMTAQISHIFTTYDQPPYTLQSGQFPFIDIGGVFSLYSTSYTPGDLANLTWNQIAAKLSNPNDQVTKDIVGDAIP